MAAEAILICHSERDLDLGQEEEYLVKNSLYRLKLKQPLGSLPCVEIRKGK